MADVQSVSNVKQKSQKSLLKKANVLGVGVGLKEVEGKKTENLAIKVLVQKKVPLVALSSKDVVPEHVNGVHTDVIEVGNIYAFQNPRDRHRPAFPGISIGHYAITAGTFGAVVRDAATNERLILSNNHVLANSNNAKTGDSIIQPGRADGGRDPVDRIADLHRFIRIQFQGDGGGGGDDDNCPIAKFFSSLLNIFAAGVGSKTRVTPIQTDPINLVDAAVAKPVTEDVITDDILDIGAVNGTVEPEIGMAVKKSGRTTGFTKGEITVIDAVVEVGYGNQMAVFQNQILTGDMSDPGDSGSLILDTENRAVGLLFAGSNTVTVMNPISAVLSTLGITF